MIFMISTGEDNQSLCLYVMYVGTVWAMREYCTQASDRH